MALPVGIHMYRLEGDGRLVFAGSNPAADRILKVDNSQFIGKSIEEAFPPLVETDVPEAYRETVRTGEPWHSHQVVYKDERIAGAYEVHAFRTAPGEMAAAFVDVTRHLQIEEELQRSISQVNDERSKADSIIAAIGDGISIQDRNYRILYQNTIHKGFFGDHTGELCYRSYEHNEGPCDGCPVAMSFADGEIHTVERRFLRNGEAISYEITVSPLRDASGEIVAGIEVIRDVSERKRSEQALMESERRYRRLIDSVTDYIFTVRVSDGIVVETRHGPGCEAVTGYKPEDYEKDDHLWYRMIHDEDRGTVLSHADTILSGGTPNPMEHRLIHKDGRVRWVKNTPVPRYNEEGRLIGYDGLISDITERKRLEEQLFQSQKMEAIGTLTGGIAHDFNNILTAIIGYGNLLLMKTEEESPSRYFTVQIMAAAEKAARLTQGLLAFSRKQIIRPVPIDINEVIRNIEKLLSRLLTEDIDLKVRLAEEVLTIVADSAQVEQILINLATNARDAMAAGGTLTIETDRFDMDEAFVRVHGYGVPGPYVRLNVSDTGHGIDKGTREKIFEPFFTTKEVGKGTGLGLAITYGIIKQHNGFVNVYSEPQKGTVFRIYLPLAGALPDVRKGSGASPPRPGSETVLLAEDNGEVRSLIGTVLRNNGYSVIEAGDGEEGLSKFRENVDVVQLIITDVMMPRIHGKDLYVEARRIRPDVRAIFMSGYTADFIHHKGILDEDVHYVPKPITPNELLLKIREVLDA